MPNRTEARPAKAALTYATGRLPLLRLFSTPLIGGVLSANPVNNNWVRIAPREKVSVHHVILVRL
jgi:hypothetical protein